MGPVHDPVDDGVGYGGVANHFVPAVDLMFVRIPDGGNLYSFDAREASANCSSTSVGVEKFNDEWARTVL